MSTGWTKLSGIAMAAGLASLVGAAVLFVLSLTGAIGDDPYTGPPPAPTIVAPRQVVQVPQPSPTSPPVPPPTPSTAAIEWLAIPRFEVVAPIVILGVDSDGVMETPNGPTNVAWYGFSARPGYPVEESGGNAVFSGHVDYYNYGPAVFWHLKDLERGDVIEVRLADGTTYRYGVTERQTVDAATAPIEDIIGDTPEEVVTLITCGGTFNSSVGEYDQRVIVRAARIYDDASETVDAGNVP